MKKTAIDYYYELKKFSGVSDIFFHGTCTHFLDSILHGSEELGTSPGLNPYTTTGVDRDSNKEDASFGGVYFTKNIKIADEYARRAVSKFGGDRLFISVNVINTEDLALDEDHINKFDHDIESKLFSKINTSETFLNNFENLKKEFSVLASQIFKSEMGSEKVSEFKKELDSELLKENQGLDLALWNWVLALFLNKMIKEKKNPIKLLPENYQHDNVRDLVQYYGNKSDGLSGVSEELGKFYNKYFKSNPNLKIRLLDGASISSDGHNMNHIIDIVSMPMSKTGEGSKTPTKIYKGTGASLISKLRSL